MQDLEIEHDGRTWEAEWINGEWHLDAQWMNLRITPVGEDFPVTETKLKYVPDVLETTEALAALDAIRYKMITDAREKAEDR